MENRLNFDWCNYISYMVENIDSWEARHNDHIRRKYGVWRWAGMFETGFKLVPIMEYAKSGIDIGGALGPLGYGDVVDQLSIDYTGAPVKYKNIQDHPGNVDFVFGSHFFEHVQEIGYFVAMSRNALKDGGKLIIHSPSIFGAKYWHPDVKPEHHWIFNLKKGPVQKDITKVVYIDALLEDAGFDIEHAEFCGDNSLIVIAKK